MQRLALVVLMMTAGVAAAAPDVKPRAKPAADAKAIPGAEVAPPPAPATRPAPRKPARPVTASRARVPAELLATASLGPASTLHGLQAYADAIQPGIGAGITEQALRAGLAGLVAATSLEGFDPSRPIQVVIAADPAQPAGGEPRFALLGKVGDARALASGAASAKLVTRNGWAVLGAPAAIDRIGNYALSTLALEPPPAAPTLTLYLPNIRARYGAALAGFRTSMISALDTLGNTGAMRSLMTSYVDGIESAAADTAQVVVTLEAMPDNLWLDFALVPERGSRLAAFAAIQQPSDMAMLGQLPAMPATMVIAGRLALGPYHDGILAAMTTIYGPDASRDVLAALEALGKALTGDVAMVMSLDPAAGMAMTQLFGTSDPAGARAGLDALMALFKAGRTFDFGKISSTTKASPEVTTYEGATLRSYDTTQDLSKLTAAEREPITAMFPKGPQRTYVTVFDKLTLLAMGSSSLTATKQAIDTVRGRGTRFAPSPQMRTLIDGARERRDSAVFAMDLGRFGSLFRGQAGELPCAFSLGFNDGRVHLRLAMPASTAAGVLKRNQP